MFQVRSFREYITHETTDGDAIELERLECTAQALRATMRKRGHFAAAMAQLRRVENEARTIGRRYA